jgi:hypothetical protein
MIKPSTPRRSLYLLILLGITGCSSDSDQPTDHEDITDPEVASRIEEDLGRLRSLEVFEVGQVVLEEDETPERASAALDAFAGTAETACASLGIYTEPNPADCTEAAVSANLAALQDLRIVEVGSLLRIAGDTEAAAQENCGRAGKLAHIVRAVQD